MNAARHPSLRRRLLLSLSVPGLILAITLGAAGWLLINSVVTRTHDRLLDAALLTIIERLGVEEGDVSVDIPLAALGMLESGSQDSVYYGVLYDGSVVTGYADLPLTDALREVPYRTVFWDGVYKGATVRLAGHMARVYGKPDPVAVVVAQTVVARRTLREQLLVALAFMEAALLVLIGGLAWRAIVRGLVPLHKLRDDIDARAAKRELSFAPLNLDPIPVEVLAPAQAFNALLVRLEQSVGAIQRFTADASHQMRTPLAVMRTHLTLARRNLASPDVARTALTETEDAVRRLDHMVYQLIALARADETMNEAADMTCDLGVVVTELVADRVPEALKAGVELQVDRPDCPVLVHGIELLVRELTANLVDNAIRYNRCGGTVNVRICQEGPVASLDVEDTGNGIPAAERERVFERFYRIPRKEAPPGSGLGLAIVRAACERIGATVSLGDRRGGPGLVITVIFRASAADQPSGPVVALATG